MARINKVKPKWKPPMNRGSPMVAKITSTANVTSSPARRAAGAPEEDIPGSRLLGPHSRDRPF